MTAARTGTIARDAAAPAARRTVSAASGPYDADANASRPSIGTPCQTPSCSSASAAVRSGLPNRTVRNVMPAGSLDETLTAPAGGDGYAEGESIAHRRAHGAE